jgi:hypothetical protein
VQPRNTNIGSRARQDAETESAIRDAGAVAGRREHDIKGAIDLHDPALSMV